MDKRPQEVVGTLGVVGILLFLPSEVHADVEPDVAEAVVHADLAVAVVEGVELERHAGEVAGVVIDYGHSRDEVEVQLVEREMSEDGVLFLY